MANEGDIVKARPLADEDVAARTAELAELEDELEQREMLLKTVRSGLRAFETSYLRAVRPKYAEVDRVEAEIVEAMLALDPDNAELRTRAREARARADASAKASEEVAQDDETGCHTPSVGLKRLFRRVALNLHPDRSLDPEETEVRHELMVEANRAYRDGDDDLLEILLGLSESGGDVPAERAELRRVLWRVERARRRLAEIARELDEVEASEIFDLWRQSEIAAEQNRDFVRDRIGVIDRSLAKSRARLEVLLSVA